MNGTMRPDSEDRPGTAAVPPSPPGPARKRPVANLVLAAALVALVAVEAWRWTAAPPPSSPFVFEGGSLVASGELENALYDPALRRPGDGPTAGSAFAGAAGETCRRFTDGPVRGIACQREGDWRVIELRQD